MRSKWLATTLWVTVLLAGTFSGAEHGSAERPQRVSLIQILADPDTFVDQRIQVVGVLALGFEVDSLCLAFEHSFGMGGACVGLGFKGLSRLDTARAKEWMKLGDWNRSYVLVEGTVVRTVGLQQVRIADVSRVAPVPLDPALEWRSRSSD